MCAFCEGSIKERAECYLSSGLDIVLEGNRLCFSYQNCRCGAFEDSQVIEYCPMCGRKLI